MDKDKRIRILKIWEILNCESDEDHPLGTEALRAKLAEFGLDCDRRTLYADIKLLNEYGYEVMCNRSTSNEYYVADRTFNIPEIQILLDAVQAASFITKAKTEELVDKIAHLAGSRKGEVLKKNIVEFNIPKSSNEGIYYIVNEIETAINDRKQISFYYFDYDIKHERVYRKDKKEYIVNPVVTVFSNDNYYLMCYDDKHGNLVNYRIDRMESVRVNETPITVTEKSKRFDLSKHKRELFGMFVGDSARVSFKADNSLLDHIFDKFGKNIFINKNDEKTVSFSANVQVSPAFIAWCCSFGSKLQVTAPNSVIKRIKEYLTEISSLYN